MTAIEELIETSDRLCKRLDEVANEDKRLCDKIQLQLERYSWELYRMTNDLKSMKDYML